MGRAVPARLLLPIVPGEGEREDEEGERGGG